MVNVLAKVAVLVAGTFAVAACGKIERLEFRSYPSGAVVRLANGATCVTPCALEIHTGRETEVMVERNGCSDGPGLYTIMPWWNAPKITVRNILRNEVGTYPLATWRFKFKGCTDKKA